ncbi:MAG: N-acetylglucosamine-6-phosphate deacetylase [Mesotoga sp.]|jgi:N-acetylglucosamine-6-phosphate deacetylase|uniref:N-acetylglucosamine-6-phosphate deacetylase n=3 Tax=Mesotoga sp. TaxID=2053577 RepID=UPI00262E9B29|nr:N-acetylglucosamine-6-phosphate deacetylase [Mesotoga sp.]MDD3680612.1 N-acetylglucosamine-6-phosphate deacetylase [Mesotoga sp.]MDD4207311.1 N-acetylglucosamine-6-phosphate deacetylase [Mesotoga sp.]MDI9368905.1 N-acetylglucosamine-6-phosphate deacetylase [Thermotogota bacterium]
MELERVLVVDPVDGEYTANVRISGTKIEAIARIGGEFNSIAMPGFVDTHSHGAVGINCMTMNTGDLQKWERFAETHGVTSLIPTTVSADSNEMKRVADLVSNYVSERPRTAVRGVHYEGPYINPKKKGAQNPSAIRPATIKELRSVLSDIVVLITMAPEIEGFLEVLPEIFKHEIIVSIGHTDATYSQIKEAYESGCGRMTHFPNGMNVLHHREIGCVGAGFLLPMKLEMIVDGIHTAPEFVQMVHKIRGGEAIILVTDSLDATGLSDGMYDLGGLKVEVKGSTATLEDGTLAGSTLTMERAANNFHRWTDCSLQELAKVTSYNALQNLGIPNRGRFKEGFVADLVLLNRKLEVEETILAGQSVFKAGEGQG